MSNIYFLLFNKTHKGTTSTEACLSTLGSEREMRSLVRINSVREGKPSLPYEFATIKATHTHRTSRIPSWPGVRTSMHTAYTCAFFCVCDRPRRPTETYLHCLLFISFFFICRYRANGWMGNGTHACACIVKASALTVDSTRGGPQ